ncbi:PREDICTED: ER lumen protein-retaining receptor A-like [Lupinus angustifolius]|uniref:ER lumen protein-retaining receptor A-like n=1 Tax=Lupinus angustifolius TaxID=3871 RepID=UPI00092F5860|nr:PREDICTED: ER lumen protein-retaining receptor A-like [Lupinus angustifolius]
MRTKKGLSPMNVLIGWLSKNSKKVNILLLILLALITLVALKFIIKDTDYCYYASQAIYIVGTLILFYKLFTHKNCSGVSLKTQELMALFLVARLCCSMVLTEANIHTTIDLTSLLSVLLVIWMIRFKLKSSYIKELDTIKLHYVIVACAVLAIVVHPHTGHFRIYGTFWSFSVYLEAISVLPQLRYMQNAKLIEPMTGKYVFALGLSKFLGLANWIIQIYETRGEYFFLDGGGYFWYLIGFIAEMVQSFILADFCYYYIKSFMQGRLLKKMPV